MAVVLPGLGYRCNEPLLWYPTRILLSLGADVLWVEYSYDKEPDWKASNDRAKKDWLFEDTAAAFKAVARERPYERATLIGKSLGTLAMGHLFASERLPENTKAVWMTPVLNDPDLKRQLEMVSKPSLLVMGSADHYYDDEQLERLRRNPAMQVLVIEGADHILETREGVIRSIDILKRITETIRQFASW